MFHVAGIYMFSLVYRSHIRTYNFVQLILNKNNNMKMIIFSYTLVVILQFNFFYIFSLLFLLLQLLFYSFFNFHTSRIFFVFYFLHRLNIIYIFITFNYN